MKKQNSKTVVYNMLLIIVLHLEILVLVINVQMVII